MSWGNPVQLAEQAGIWYLRALGSCCAPQRVRDPAVLSPGALSGRGRGSREDDGGRTRLQHPPGHQLPGVLAEEELAECACPVHQEHHGEAPAPVLRGQQ